MSAPFDLIVIGGGVNGTAIARDAQGRLGGSGARVLLLEARDLAGGTSSASTKLVHGGLRYLEHYEFALVREALGERETLWRTAPHIVRPLRFVLPVSGGTRPAWMLRAGLFLYDHIGGSGTLPGTDSIDLSDHVAGSALKPGMTRAFEYSDGWVDDARLVVLNALDADERGVEVRTRTPVTSARREGEMWRVETPAGAFLGRALVNAGGPAADDVARLCGTEPEFTLRRVRGSHIVVRKLYDHPFAYIFQLPDGRIVFAIPYEEAFTLIGTTDRDESAPFEVRASEDEIAYLCEAASEYFAKAITRADVVWSYSGVRALIDDGSGKPEAASRGYHLPLSPPDTGAPLLGVYGGKITSSRALAEEAVDALAERLPALSGTRWTADSPLPGGDFPKEAQGELIAGMRRAYPFLSEGDATRIARAYGTRAGRWLGQAQRSDDLGRSFGAGLSQAEVGYLRDVEWAQTAEDVLWRRSKLGLHMSASERAGLAEYLGG